MRVINRTFVAIAAVLLVAPQLAAAEDVEVQIEQMQDRIEELEEAEAERASRDFAISAISDFLNDTDFGGNVAASYNYNFMNPPQGAAGGANNDPGVITGITASHYQHNTFQLDQLWFSMANESNEDSPAGFGVDLIYGAVSDGNRAGTGVGFENGNIPLVFQAYAGYQFGLLGGITMDGGIFATPIGAELLQQGLNYTITNGILWNNQPVNHTGLRIGMDVGPIFLQGIVANTGKPLGVNADVNKAKSGIFTVGWSTDTLGLTANYMIADYPGAAASNATQVGLEHFVDLVMTWDPSDRFGLWLNFDWNKFDNARVTPDPATGAATGNGINDPNDAMNLGLAFAGRFGITDKMAINGRFEWFRMMDEGGRVAKVGDSDQYSVTGTLDYALVDHLMLRGEVRWDNASSLGSPFDGGTNNNQVLGIAQMIYTF